MCWWCGSRAAWTADCANKAPDTENEEAVSNRDGLFFFCDLYGYVVLEAGEDRHSVRGFESIVVQVRVVETKHAEVHARARRRVHSIHRTRAVHAATQHDVL